MTGKLRRSLRKIAMAAQAQFQPLLGGSRILLLTKNVGTRSSRILQQVCRISAEFVDATLDAITVRSCSNDSTKPYVVKDVPMPLTDKI